MKLRIFKVQVYADSQKIHEEIGKILRLWTKSKRKIFKKLIKMAICFKKNKQQKEKSQKLIKIKNIYDKNSKLMKKTQNDKYKNNIMY